MLRAKSKSEGRHRVMKKLARVIFILVLVGCAKAPEQSSSDCSKQSIFSDWGFWYELPLDFSKSKFGISETFEYPHGVNTTCEVTRTIQGDQCSGNILYTNGRQTGGTAIDTFCVEQSGDIIPYKRESEVDLVYGSHAYFARDIK